MQEHPYHTTKEQIRSRLLRHAVTFWGISTAADLDPMVQLLIEGLATELYNLSSEMRYSESRLLEKLAGLLTPDLLTAPTPAHAILQAQPLETLETLPATRQFLHTTRRNPAPSGEFQADCWFTPIQKITLPLASIAWLASGNRAYNPDADGSGQAPLQARPGKYLEGYTLWIGLKIPPGGQGSFPPLTFYFASRNDTLAEEWYRLLPLSTWTINGHPLEMRQGLLPAPPPGQHPAGTADLLGSFGTMEVLMRDISRYYAKRYLHCPPTPLPPEALYPRNYPDQWESVFSPGDLTTLKDPLLWLEVRFPPSIGLRGLEELEVRLNTFPVVNRKLVKLKHRFKGIGNIIPLRQEPGAHFLGIHRLSDSKGNIYEPIPVHGAEGQPEGSYSIRSGGAERFDQRNAREMIEYLFELLRDESAAFSAYGFDFLTNTLKSLRQSLTLVEQKARQTLTAMTESTRYIVVKPLDASETMHLEYWTTQGTLPMQLRTGTILLEAEGSSLKADSLRLITRPVGGKLQPPAAGRLQAYKYALMTRDRIVTEEDIRLFVHYELGDRLGEVSIRKGVMISSHPKEGLRRTIDVVLKPSRPGAITPEEWTHLSRELSEKLETRSSVQSNYRVLLEA